MRPAEGGDGSEADRASLDRVRVMGDREGSLWGANRCGSREVVMRRVKYGCKR